MPPRVKRTKEEIVDNGLIPIIDIFFVKDEETVPSAFNNGKAQFVEKIINDDNTTSWVYRYVVTNGDYGELNLKWAVENTNSEISDLLGNILDLKVNGIGYDNTNAKFIDTLSPHVSITAEANEKTITNNTTNADKIKFTFFD